MTGAYLVTTLIVFSLLYAIQLYYGKSILMKLINLTILVFISSAVYFTFETYKGWPTTEQLREKARVYSIMIVTPVQGVHDGGIYFLAKEKTIEPTLLDKIFRYQPKMPNAPRVYYVPYTQEDERTFSVAKDAIEQGKIVYMKPPKKEQKEQSGQKGQGGQDGDNGIGGLSKQKGSQNNEDEPDDYDAEKLEILSPDQYLPPKEGQE